MRPRESYLVGGPEGLGDIELIALVLGTGAGGRSARAIAADIVESDAGLAGVCAGALAGIRGVGPARAIRLHAGIELGRRLARARPARQEPVTGAAAAARWFVPALGALDHEEFHALYLDRRLRPLACRRLTSGNDAATVVDARQVLRGALAVGAHAVVVAHNHPSGDLTPSGADREVTERLRHAGSAVGIEILDHLLVAGAGWMSILEAPAYSTPQRRSL